VQSCVLVTGGAHVRNDHPPDDEIHIP
jgi:hypothetical protein